MKTIYNGFGVGRINITRILAQIEVNSDSLQLLIENYKDCLKLDCEKLTVAITGT